MGRRERKIMVLRFLAEHGLALPPKLIHRNMSAEMFVPFSLRTTERVVAELHEEGLVERLEWARGSYRITPAGREWLAAQSDT